jgi:hypothetical protein
MSKKNLGGRPPLYTDPEVFNAKAEEYIKLCEGNLVKDSEGNPILDKWGNVVRDGKKPTLSGLAYYMGFESKQSLYDYAKRDGFSYPTSRIRLWIESSYEEDLRTPGISPTGPAFALKNMGWSDKQEIEHSTIDESGQPTGIKFID